MRYFIIIFFLCILFPLNIFACSCIVSDDSCFRKTSEYREFVALAKIVSIENNLDSNSSQYPQFAIAEIITVYKGKERKKRIEIWGGNGGNCKKSISKLKLNNYYLIAPEEIKNDSLGRKDLNDYYFFLCAYDYLEVDIINNIALGKYSPTQNSITLKRFEKNINSIFMDFQLFLMYFMAALYIFAGISHFRIPKFFLAITPKWVSYPEKVNILVGIIEIALGVLLLIPKTQSIAAYLIIALLIAVFPANVYHFQKAKEKGKGVIGTAIRLPIQLLLIYWAYQYT